MTETIDLERIERTAFRAYLEDGLWDMFLGTMMLTWGIRSITDVVWWTLLILIAIPVFMLGKRFVTVPRLGRVVFNRQRANDHIVLLLGILVALLATVGILAATQEGLLPDVAPGDLYFAIMVIVIFGLIAYLLDHWRFFLWGVLIATGMLVSGFIGRTEGAWVMLILGIVAFAMGVVSFAMFLRANPKLEIEEA